MSQSKTRTDSTDPQAASLIEGLEADLARLLGDHPTQDDLVIACGCFTGYPLLLETIKCCPKWSDEAKRRARMTAEALYHAAVTALAHEAGRRKMDPHPLIECGRVVVEIYRDPGKLRCHGTYDTFPECMGSWRYELPADQQTAIREGAAAFDRLITDMNITPTMPSIVGQDDKLERRDDDEQQAPALTAGERMTLAALAAFDPSRLATAADVSEAMSAAERRSERTVRLAINKLVKLDLAERPEGAKQGSRLTIRGRRLATKIAD